MTNTKEIKSAAVAAYHAAVAAGKGRGAPPEEARSLFPETSRNTANSFGSYEHTVTVRIAPGLCLGMAYSAPRIPMPENGGDVAAGNWADTRPIGRLMFLEV